jgi:hypothetical protein
MKYTYIYVFQLHHPQFHPYIYQQTKPIPYNTIQNNNNNI